MTAERDDLADALWLDERIVDLANGIDAARDIWTNWYEGRHVGRLHPGLSAGEFIASRGLRLTLPEALEAMPDASTRQVAAVAGVGTMTVSRARQAVPDGTPDRVRGADGNSYPAHRPIVIVGPQPEPERPSAVAREAVAALDAVARLDVQAIVGSMTPAQNARIRAACKRALSTIGELDVRLVVLN